MDREKKPYVIVAAALAAALAFALGGAVGSGIANTPDECIKALDAHDDLMSEAIEPALEANGEALKAASELDVNGLYAAADELDALAEPAEKYSEQYDEASEKCRD